jgi:hypothetical protein
MVLAQNILFLEMLNLLKNNFLEEKIQEKWKTFWNILVFEISFSKVINYWETHVEAIKVVQYQIICIPYLLLEL